MTEDFMTVQDAIGNIHAPKGMTSLIAGVMSGDFDPIQNQDAVGASLAIAQEKLGAVKKAQLNCKSDWAYWGYQGDISYWTAVVDILKAAEITGPQSLPYIEKPELNGVVMDVCSKVEAYGKNVLEAAKGFKEENIS